MQTSPWKPQNTPLHLIHTADADATLIAIATAVTSIIFIIINPTHLQAPNASSSTLTHQVVIEVGEYISETVHWTIHHVIYIYLTVLKFYPILLSRDSHQFDLLMKQYQPYALCRLH